MATNLRRARVLAVAGACTGLLAACGGGGGGATYELTEWSVEGPSSLDGGTVEITADNVGGELHELVVVRADSIDDWDIDETGKVLEDQFSDDNLLGEIEEFEAGTAETATFDLTPGTYILFCNIVEQEEDGEWESHFLEGMWTTVEVT